MRWMTKVAACFAMLVVSGLMAQEASTLKLEKFTSEKGKYSIKFPGKPSPHEQKVNTDVGEITINMDVVSLSNEVAFLVSVNDYPDSIKNSNKDAVLDGVVNGNAGKDGEIEDNEKITFGTDKLPGRRVLIKKPEGMYMRNLVILKGTRLYQVMVVGKKSFIEHEKVDEFFKSFALSK